MSFTLKLLAIVEGHVNLPCSQVYMTVIHISIWLCSAVLPRAHTVVAVVTAIARLKSGSLLFTDIRLGTEKNKNVR